MFPFAFGVPLSSRNNSPAVIKSPPVIDNNPFNAQSTAPGANGQETYAQKKANWKSSLRKPHPFLFREPRQSGYTSTASTSDASHISSNDKRASRRSLSTARRVLTVCAVTLSIVLVIIGVIYIDKLTPKNPTPTTGISLPAIEIGNTNISDTKVDTTPKDGGELRMRVGKRIDAAPVPEPNPLDNANLGSSSSVDQVLSNAKPKADTQPISAMTRLFFYVAAMPIITIIHACVQIAVFTVLKRLYRHRNKSSPTLSFEDDDSFCDSDDEEIDEEKFKHELAYPALPISPDLRAQSHGEHGTNSNRNRKPFWAPLVSVITSLLVVAGWTILNGIQINCEFMPAGKSSKACPAPLRVDNLNEIKGLRGMSIARTALSWTVVLVYIIQILLIVKQYKLYTLRCLRRSGPTDAEASPKASPSPNTSPRTLNSILSRGRSRSNSSRRKTVRFDLEEASRRQSEKGDDVHYIPAPSDGYDNGYGLTYNYSSDHAYAPNGGGNGGSDVRTPWQWQGQFEEFVNRTQTSHGLNTNPIVAATLTAGSKMPSNDKTTGSFDFGLASMRKMAREQNAALAYKTGLKSIPVRSAHDPHGLTSHPTIGVAVDRRSRLFTSDTSEVVPIAFSSTAGPFKPKFVTSQLTVDTHNTDKHLKDSDTIISPMTNGRKSFDLDVINEHGKKDVSPISN